MKNPPNKVWHFNKMLTTEKKSNKIVGHINQQGIKMELAWRLKTYGGGWGEDRYNSWSVSYKWLTYTTIQPIKRLNCLG